MYDVFAVCICNLTGINNCDIQPTIIVTMAIKYNITLKTLLYRYTVVGKTESHDKYRPQLYLMLYLPLDTYTHLVVYLCIFHINRRLCFK